MGRRIHRGSRLETHQEERRPEQLLAERAPGARYPEERGSVVERHPDEKASEIRAPEERASEERPPEDLLAERAVAERVHEERPLEGRGPEGKPAEEMVPEGQRLEELLRLVLERWRELVRERLDEVQEEGQVQEQELAEDGSILEQDVFEAQLVLALAIPQEVLEEVIASEVEKGVCSRPPANLETRASSLRHRGAGSDLVRPHLIPTIHFPPRGHHLGLGSATDATPRSLATFQTASYSNGLLLGPAA